MADSREGNVLYVPGTSQVAEVKGDEILASYARFTQKGLTILAGSGVLEAGTLLKESGTPNKWEGVAAADVDGTTDPSVVVLRKAVNATDEDKLANYVVSGIIKGDALKLADGSSLDETQVGNAVTTLGASVDPVHGYIIL